MARAKADNTTADEMALELKRRIKVLRAEVVPVWEKMADVLVTQIQKQIGLLDHTPKDFRRMGHPYRMQDRGDLFGKGFAYQDRKGKWHLGIRKLPRQIREGTLGHDIKLVHIQSGKLIGALRWQVRTTDNFVVMKVWVDRSAAPHALWVIKGTRKMIPRNFMGTAAVKARGDMLGVVRRGMSDISKLIGINPAKIGKM